MCCCQTVVVCADHLAGVVARLSLCVLTVLAVLQVLLDCHCVCWQSGMCCCHTVIVYADSLTYVVARLSLCVLAAWQSVRCCHQTVIVCADSLSGVLPACVIMHRVNAGLCFAVRGQRQFFPQIALSSRKHPLH